MASSKSNTESTSTSTYDSKQETRLPGGHDYIQDLDFEALHSYDQDEGFGPLE